MTTKQVNGREIVLDILMEVLEKDGYSHLVLRQALNKYQYLDKQERSFITRVAEGTIEYRLQIDYILNLFSKVKVSKMKPVVRTILRMSVYQICHMDRVPDSAVCNEAVKLAGKRGFQGLKGFINGVLRNVSRQKDSIEFPDRSIRYSMPQWILDMWEADYGVEITVRMLKAFLEDGGTSVRCNTSRASIEDIICSLKQQEVKAEVSVLSDSVLQIEGYDYLESLEAFQKGWIYPQDISSSLVGQLAAPKEGDYVIDVCGAPGGKSIHVADQLHGTGCVDVRDVSDYKVSLIEDNARRAGLQNLKVKIWDALAKDSSVIEKADILLADLPCSGLGIIGKKTDIKYRMTPEQAAELAKLQRDMLDVVWTYVKPGGILIYSTCTIDKKENEQNRAWFLENHPFIPVSIEGRLGANLQEETMKEGYLQLLPGVHPCDGFFISVMKREG